MYAQVADVKKKVADKQGPDFANVRLIYSGSSSMQCLEETRGSNERTGKILVDANTVGSYNIKESDHIICMQQKVRDCEGEKKIELDANSHSQKRHQYQLLRLRHQQPQRRLRHLLLRHQRQRLSALLLQARQLQLLRALPPHKHLASVDSMTLLL